MIFPILLMSTKFCTAQVQPDQRTIPTVSDEHGILSFGDPFEQNENTQEQSPSGSPLSIDELPLSTYFFQEMDVELPQLHVYLQHVLKMSLTDEDIDSFSTDLSQPVYTLVSRAHQQKVSPTLSQETVVMETNIEPAATDLRTLLTYGGLQPRDDTNMGASSFNTNTESFLNDSYQFENALMADPKRQAKPSSAQFCAVQVKPGQRTIPIVSDEHGILSFGDPFEENETIQEQSPTDKLQLMDKLSVGFFQGMDVTPSPTHIFQQQAKNASITDQDIESLYTGLSQPLYTLMGRAHQQEVSPTLSKETFMMETNIEPADTDLGTLLAYGDLGPLSVDDINVEPLSSDTDMEIFVNDTYQFEKLLVADAKRRANTSDPLAYLHISATFTDPSSDKVRNVDEKGDRDMACPIFSGSATGQSLGSVRSNFGQSVVPSDNSKDSPNPFQCDMCPKQFRKLSNCKRHRRIHTGEKPFKCDFCQKEFSDCTTCLRHQRTHTDEKPFQCDICQKLFRTSGNYQTHRRTHTGEKPFQCDICQKLFRNSGNYQKHRRTHTGEKPFKCDFCEKEFSDCTTCQRHRRAHTGEKPFQCEICPKQFSISDDYRSHLRIHTGNKPFQCYLCPKQFRTSGSYQKHRRTHTGEKPFKCDFCHKEFSDRSNCLRHRREHTR